MATRVKTLYTIKAVSICRKKVSGCVRRLVSFEIFFPAIITTEILFSARF